MVCIEIDENLKKQFKNLKLGVIQYKAKVEKASNKLLSDLDELCDKLENQYKIEEVNSIENIKDIRDAYKAMGKDPGRYRVSSEALLRRIVQGKGIYHVNNIVDVNNLVSLKSCFPVGSYNLDKLEGKIVFRKGLEEEKYKGIGKGEVNLHNMPLFSDDKGAFGSLTSDSERSMISEDAENLLMIIICFSNKDLKETVRDTVKFLEDYVEAKDIEFNIV